MSGTLLILLLLFSLCPFAMAADQMDYDCTVYIYGVDSTPQTVTSGIAIQIQAGDGSGNTWAVADYSITSGATQYVVIDPLDSDSYSIAKLIAGDAASGIAVFQLESRLTGRTAPALRTLDGLNAGDVVRVTGISRREDQLYLSSIVALAGDLISRSGYSVLTLEDTGDTTLAETGFLPMSAVMDTNGNVLGFYGGDYRALPSGYIMTQADGIGSLGPGEEQPEDTQEPDDPSGDADQQPSGGIYTLETVQSDTGIAELLAQANARKARTKTVQLLLVAVTVLIAAGIVLFALRHSRKGRKPHEVTPKEQVQARQEPAQSMGQTEYVGPQPFGETEPAVPAFQIVPLPDTPGQARRIPSQGLTFGRSPECTVSFAPDTGGVSGRHCSLTFRDGQLILTDLGSSYGTLLEDGRNLSAGESAALRAGDCFYLGSRKIGFEIKPY